jgi:hypothetical protein
MAATFIPALVVKHNNDVYLTEDLVIGVTMPIPTPGSGAVIDGDYWAVPITDNGIVTGFDFEPTTPTDTTPPTPQSFHVFRLVNRFGNDVWYVVGTTTTDGDSPANDGYIQAAQDAECCDETPRTLPTDVPELFPCQTACQFDADGNYFFILGVPTLGAGESYVANGYLDDETLSEASGASVTALVASLNSLWDNVGSPAIAITWTESDTGSTGLPVIIGTITSGGDGTSDLCGKISTV